MKLCVKKIYCARCRRLVRGREQGSNSHVTVSCSRCGTNIWSWNGATWRYLVKNVL